MSSLSSSKEVDYSNTIAIVGAGAAGCVLANRVLANTTYNVLLLERGPREPHHAQLTRDLSRFPAGLNHNADWISTTNQEGLNDRLLWLHTASGMGGTSVLNGGIFTFGRKENYANWPGKHFTQTNFGRAAEEVCKIHKPQVISKGLLPKETPAGKIETKIQEKFGFSGTTGKDMLWIQEDGIYACNASTAGSTGEDARIRRTTADSFLTESVRANERLSIFTDANVTRLLTENSNSGDNKLTVTGLEYETYTTISGYKILTKTAKLSGFREVVLSCGSIRTPRLLMASGIGPKDEVDKAKVTQVLDLEAVGKGLWDHAIVFFPIEIDDKNGDDPENFPPCCTPCDNNITIKTYRGDRKVCFYHMGPQVSYNIPGDIIVPRFEDSGMARRMKVFMVNTLRGQIYPVTNKRLGIVAAGLLTPTSRGSVGFDTVDPGCLKDKGDKETMADAFRDLLCMLRESGMKVAVPDFDMNPKNRQAMMTGMGMLAGPFWHLAGSCSQAVDPDTLKVKGTSNLRIVDASVVPTNIEANTQGPTMLTAYLAGELF